MKNFRLNFTMVVLLFCFYARSAAGIFPFYLQWDDASDGKLERENQIFKKYLETEKKMSTNLRGKK